MSYAQKHKFTASQATIKSDCTAMEDTMADTTSFGAVCLDDSESFGLLLNFREASNTQWEILYSKQSTDADITGLTTGDESVDMTVHYLQAGGTYQGEGEVARPYLAATIGAAHYDIKTTGFDSDTFFSFSIGPGLQIRPNDRLGIRLEASVDGCVTWIPSAWFASQ